MDTHSQRSSTQNYLRVQDGAEPSVASVAVHNLQRLAHFAEDRHAEYQEKAKRTLFSQSQIIEHTPFMVATMVGAAVTAEKGYRQVRSTHQMFASTNCVNACVV